ncbi:MAG: bifunctional adenosylcobinamide kinase/adenosylcobinamide-phosphate guanylyltransferase [Leptospirales bacterium]|nr:bifunctional adenosylcobinamide kinase/adenosylcobinamide-phosphate guanylyltransferase [Leptospirales bacterium]
MSKGEIHLVLGGSRSGKSSFALKLAESLGDSRTFIATAPVLDVEMKERIHKHKLERQGRGWNTIEEQTKLASVLADLKSSVVLIDCLTLWINNLLYVAGAGSPAAELTEEDIAKHSLALMKSSRQSGSTVIFVSNEVGLGIVPENRLARRFRDMAGRCNQIVAAEAEHVHFLVSGIPMRIK